MTSTECIILCLFSVGFGLTIASFLWRRALKRSERVYTAVNEYLYDTNKRITSKMDELKMEIQNYEIYKSY